jgi:hypothetical protein
MLNMARGPQKSKPIDPLAEATVQLARATAEAAAINRRGSIQAAKINFTGVVVAAIIAGTCGVTGVGVQGYFTTEQAKIALSPPARFGYADGQLRHHLNSVPVLPTRRQRFEPSDQDLYLTTAVQGKNLLVISDLHSSNQELDKWKGFGRRHGATSVKMLRLASLRYTSLRASGVFDIKGDSTLIVMPTMTA